MVDGDRHLRQHRRMAVGVAGDQAADAHALGGFGHRGLQRPAFKNRPVWAARANRCEMVEIPDVIEVRFVGDLPDDAQLLDGAVLARQLQAEAKWVRHGVDVSGTWSDESESDWGRPQRTAAASGPGL